jgi:streptogramin lyase
LAANGYTISGGDEVYGLTIDTHNNIWVTNEEQPHHGNAGSVTVFNGAASGSSMGTYLSGNQFFYGSDTDFPESMSADANGNVFVANYGNSSASIFNSSASEVTSAIGSGGGAAFPVAISGDVTNGVASHGLWLANQGDYTVSHFDPNGNLLARVTCCDGASGVATDAFGNVWVTNYYGQSVSEVSNANTVLITGDTQGGVTYPSSLVVDAGQNVWVANFRGASVSELAGNANTLAAGTGISPSNGYGHDAFLVDPFGIAVDASGNVWMSSFNGNSLTMFFGLATPTATPILPVPTAP